MGDESGHDFLRWASLFSRKSKDADERGDTQGSIFNLKTVSLAAAAAALAALQIQISTGTY